LKASLAALTSAEEKDADSASESDGELQVESKDSKASEPTKSPTPTADYRCIYIDFEECKVGEDVASEVDEYAPTGGMHAGRTCRKIIDGLEPGHFFSAKVQAINAVGVSSKIHSDLLRTVSNVPDVPSKPRARMDKATRTSVAFEWNPSADDGGEEVLGYQVAWIRLVYLQEIPTRINEILEGEGSERVDLGNAECKYEITGLAAGDSVVPVVRCWNAVGFSGWSRMPDPVEIKGFVTLAAPPSPIVIPPLLAKAASKDYKPYSLTASWKCPHLNGWPVKYFILSIQLGGDPPVKSEDGPGVRIKELRVEHDGSSPDWLEGDDVSLSFAHEGLIPGAPYVLNVRAGTGFADVGDCEDWGATSPPELAPPDKPLKPLSPSCPWQWPDALQVEWIEPCMRGAPLKTAEMCYSRSADMSNLIHINKAEDINNIVVKKEVVVDKLSYTTAYYFKMRIANDVGWSPWSDVSPAFLTKATRPLNPAALDATEVLQKSFSVMWFPPADHGAKITEYELLMVDTRYCENFKELVDQANSCGGDDSHEFVAHKVEEAVEALFKTATLKACDRLKVEELQDPDAPTHTFTGCFGGITYSAAVRAYNSEGWSNFSPVLSVETPSAKPEKCAQLVLVESLQTSLKMQYEAPYDNGAPLTGFEIFWRHVVGPKDRHNARMLGGEAQDHAPEISGTIQIDLRKEGLPRSQIGDKGVALLEGLQPGTDYEAQVCANNKHGNGLHSHIIRMQTAPGRPDAPLDVRHSASAKNLLQDPHMQNSRQQEDKPVVVSFSQTSKLQVSEVMQTRH
jgi:hypothetical protein